MDLLKNGKDLTNLSSSSEDTLFSEGLRYAKQGNMLEAAQYFRAAIADNPNNISCHINLGNVYQALGEINKAKQHLLQALRLDPHHAEGYNNLGCLFYKQQLFQEAIFYFQKTLRINPDYWEAHYNLAHAFSKQNLLSRASVHYREVIRLQPNHPTAAYHLGLIYFEEGYFPKALEHLARAVELDPANGLARHYLAHAYLAMGEIGLAQISFEQALAWVSTDLQGEIHHNLAVLYLRQENRNKALYHFEQTLILQPDNETARHMKMAMEGSQASQLAPTAYVASLFDQYAHYYNEHVKEKLHYAVPGLLRSAVGKCLVTRLRTGRILDLGCGTGLCGVYFRDLAMELVGVDLSPKMIEKAQELGAYESLCAMDILDYLVQPSLAPFDIIIAGDVLVYMGDLAGLFQGVAAVLKPEGLFAFTTEQLAHGKYFLQKTGRFSHAASYIHALAKQYHFNVEFEESIVPRLAAGEAIDSQLFVLRRIP